MMNQSENDPNPFESPHSGGETGLAGSRRSHAILWGSVGVTVVVIVGLLFFAPGLSVLAALILVPANIRFFVRLSRDAHYAGQWPSIRYQIELLILSVVLTALVMVGASIAFVTVCGGSALIASSLPNVNEYGLGVMLFVCVPLGLVAGGSVLVYSYRETMDRAPRRPPLRDDKTEGDS